MWSNNSPSMLLGLFVVGSSITGLLLSQTLRRAMRLWCLSFLSSYSETQDLEDTKEGGSKQMVREQAGLCTPLTPKMLRLVEIALHHTGAGS